jgi:hypothetical protein
MHWYTIPAIWLGCAVVFNFLKGIWLPNACSNFDDAFPTIVGTIFAPVGAIIMVCVTAYKAGEAFRITTEKGVDDANQ